MKNKNSGKSLDFEIIWKAVHGNMEEDEKILLNEWLEQNQRNRVYFQKVKEHFAGNELELVEADLKHLRNSLASRRKSPKSSNKKKTLFISVAASVILILSFISIFTKREDKLFELEHAKPIVSYPEPGKQQAILHLGGGEKLLLGEKSSSNDKEAEKIDNFLNLKKESLEYKKSSSSASKQHELEVQTGGEFMLVLSDGTKVWINSESRLKYPASFGTDKRVVELSGEAYFEVAHDASRPFEVVTGNQTIRVLGTSFNVTGYPKEETISTLLEGKIQIETSKNKTAVLSPGDQAIYHPQNQKLHKKQVNVEHSIAWKNGLFYFKDKQLEHIMEVLARWYKIEVEYKNPQKRKIRFTGTLKRYSSFKEVINLIEMTGDVKFSISNNNKVIIE
ncbi:FecR domain-containing protein [Marivirga sp.]|uniref:FecR family protein n=1 Tax=Marivirga sp. TaxID=2018662 RepID=UPI0025DF2243|nr:FecR domain-containing protein [Marivirga sp.]